MEEQHIIIFDDDSKKQAVLAIYKLKLEPANEIIIRPYKKGKRQRTNLQNASLHKWLTLLAIEMNNAGITQRELIGRFKKGFELPVTMEMLKDVFREVGKAMYHKDSTANLSTTEMVDVHRVVEQRISEITGVFVPWPSDTPPPY